MLDGHENVLEVAEHKTLDSASEPKSSPLKQATLDSFIKRCNSPVDCESQPKLKYPRH